MTPNSTQIRRRFDRIAPFYDLIEAPIEGLAFGQWRERLWSKVAGHHILEVGVGTGKNVAYYPKDARITAIDFSPKMLEQATQAKARNNAHVELALMDVQSLSYADNSFDNIIATFVFCSVPLPNKGLKELYRVCKPGGRVLLLEHVISANPVLAKFMRLLNPVTVKLFGANINRDTVKKVKACGFSSVRVDERSGDILKLIEARK
jgi:phosphatidylethanolamine/phosphatidyl-N-methylethanolamine N-methyltransferase